MRFHCSNKLLTKGVDMTSNTQLWLKAIQNTQLAGGQCNNKLKFSPIMIMQFNITINICNSMGSSEIWDKYVP